MPPLLIACFCATWCDTCNTYQAAFMALAKTFNQAQFIWLDIDRDATLADAFDVETFPTILIQREQHVLFFGAMLPDTGQLKRLIQILQNQTLAEQLAEIQQSPEKQLWQSAYNLRRQLQHSA